jgi:4-alpha-glucanotransferase
MEKDGYDWWSQRLKHLFSLFDGVRIDHFRGLESYWSVPAGALTAREGQWMPGPGLPFCKKIRELAGDKLVIAEDLGEITPQVAQCGARQRVFPHAGFPVCLFGTGQRPSALPYTPECVAYSGTHDTYPFGLSLELDEPTRARVRNIAVTRALAAGLPGDFAHPVCLRRRYADYAVQDLLGYGADTRINTPGTARGNWRYRLAREQFLDIDAARFLRLNALYGRCPKK